MMQAEAIEGQFANEAPTGHSFENCENARTELGGHKLNLPTEQLAKKKGK
jgi:hypothetical protein